MKKILAVILSLLLMLAPLSVLALTVEPAPTVQTAVDGLVVPAAVLDVPETRPPIDLTDIVNAILGLAATLITIYVIPWLKQKKLEKWATVAVYAAEKILGPKLGPDKLVKARTWLQQWGYDINSSKVQAAIEAAVQQLSMEQAKPNTLNKQAE